MESTKLQGTLYFMSPNNWCEDDVISNDELSRNLLAVRAEEIVRSEVGETALETTKAHQEQLLKNAGQAKPTKTDGQALLSKATNIPLDDVTRSDQSAVSAVGFAVVNSDNRLPANDFFIPGRTMVLRVKHSCFPVDRKGNEASYKTLSIKFNDHDEDSPFDLPLCTGRHGPYYNSSTMDQFYGAMRNGNPDIKKYLLENPICLESVLGGLRFEPSSYSDQRYYSHAVYQFNANDGKRRLVRFRVTPGDQRKKQTGLLTADQQLNAWNFLDKNQPESTSTRSESYLRDEFIRHLVDDKRGVHYTLQIQLYDVTDDDDIGEEQAPNAADNVVRVLRRTKSSSSDDDWAAKTRSLFNPCLDWSDKPWVNVAQISAVQLLPVESTSINVGRLPTTVLRLPDPMDAEDFCSKQAVESQQANVALTSASNVANDGVSDVANAGNLVSTDYLVHCVTGDCIEAGTLSNVFISIVGTSGRTPYMKLDRQSKNDQYRGTSKTFVLWDRPVGNLRYVQVYNEGAPGQTEVACSWYLAYAIVSTPYNGRCYTLPCYRWIANRGVVTLRDGQALTRRRDLDPFNSLMRDVETSDRRQQFQWYQQSPGDAVRMPGYVSAGNDVKALPADLLTDSARSAEKFWSEYKLKKSLLKVFMDLFSSRKGSFTAEFEKTLADKIQQKYQNSRQLVHVIRHWREDDEFSRQMFNGTHPSLIVQLKGSLPAEFAELTDDLLQGELQPNRTIQDEINDGRLYMISYSPLAEYAQACYSNAASGSNSKQQVCYTSASSVLFYLKTYDSGVIAMIPIAINLNPPSSASTSDPAAATGGGPPKLAISPLFTRQDARVAIKGSEYTDWMVAKMWVRSADVHSRLIGELIGSRLLVETAWLTVQRWLPAVHPVHKLLAPHLADIIGLNTVYRRYVLDAIHRTGPSSESPESSVGKGSSQGGVLPYVLALSGTSGLNGLSARDQYAKLVADMLRSTTIESLNIRKNFERLGLLNTSLPVGYWYRDDALTLWDAIWNFVTDILSIYYDNANDVAHDVELAAMLKELRHQSVSIEVLLLNKKQLGEVEPPKTNQSLTFPEKFNCLEDLTQFVTVFIFTCTVQQTALRRASLDVYAYCPNAPPCLMRPVPSERHHSGYTEQQMKDMLPSPDLAEQFIDVVTALAGDDSPPKVALGCYAQRLFTENAPLMAIERFQTSLRLISDQMRSRNKNLLSPYEYLLPENVYQSFSA